jgi:mRNA interferase YafQ
MPGIRRTTQFKRDFKRELRGRHRSSVGNDLQAALSLLFAGRTLPARYFDHALSGEWKDHRDCHLKPDLVLIYRWDEDDTLALVRLGSHSELGL